MSKHAVVRRILSALETYMRPDKAIMATLGGHGVEAALWNGKTLVPEHCWIIERDTPKRRALRARFPEFQFVPRLSQFPSRLQRTYGDRARLDLFHLDLCGTVEPNISDLTPALPFLLRGEGMTLAVTAADQRRNRSTDESGITQALVCALFRDEHLSFSAQLTQLYGQEHVVREQTTSDPEKAALREISVLAHLLLAFAAIRKQGKGYALRRRCVPIEQFERFRRTGDQMHLSRVTAGVLHVLPDAMHRCVYWNTETNFRMRTFIFHLAVLSEPVGICEGAARLVEMVRRVPYTILNGGEPSLLWPRSPPSSQSTPAPVRMSPPASALSSTPVTEKGQTKMVARKTPAGPADHEIDDIKARLDPVFRVMGEDAQRDYARLIQLSKQSVKLARVTAELHRLYALLTTDDLPETLETVANPVSSDQSAPATSAKKRRSRAKRKRGGSKKKRSEAHRRGGKKPPPLINSALSIEEKDRIRLGLKRAAVKGARSYKVRLREAAAQLGVAVDSQALKMFQARGVGGFRGQFVARLLAATDKSGHAALLEELAGLETTSEEVVTAGQLSQEAKEAASS